ncbi:unnamed protein product, partial [Mesorhabditis belari]|uniref:Integrase zinc-binding domain-containing protein n=1 Tax=Mesorhabditis belari TaxID=2138241 RepID=A0AAF3EFY0_9BILA
MDSVSIKDETIIKTPCKVKGNDDASISLLSPTFSWDRADESDESEDENGINQLTEKGAPYGGMRVENYEKIVRNFGRNSSKTKTDYFYRNGLLSVRRNGEERYVLVEGEVEMLWQQCHLQCGHSLRKPLFDLLSKMFTYGPNGGSLWVDATTVRSNCFECQRLGRKSAVAEGLDWEKVIVMVEVGSGVPGDRIRVRLNGTPSMDGHNKRVSKLAARIGPEKIFEYSVPRIRHVSLLRYKIDGEFPNSYSRGERTILESHARAYLVDQADSRVLVWRLFPGHPILICSEETFEIARAAHHMLEHIPDQYISKILSKTVFWRGMSRSLRTVAQQCSTCGTTGNKQRRPVPIESDFKNAEFGISITFLPNNRRKFDLDYGNISREVLDRLAADLIIPTCSLTNNKIKDENPLIPSSSPEKSEILLKKSPKKLKEAIFEENKTSINAINQSVSSINHNKRNQQANAKRSSPKKPVQSQSISNEPPLKRKSPRKQISEQNGVQNSTETSSKSAPHQIAHESFNDPLKTEPNKRSMGPYSFSFGYRSSLSEEEIQSFQQSASDSTNAEPRCTLRTTFGNILCPIGYKPIVPIQAKSTWETKEEDTTCVKRLSFSFIKATAKEITDFAAAQKTANLDGTPMETIVGEVAIPDGYYCVGYRTENEIKDKTLELVIEMKLRKI